jgi:hypothetical protein
VESALAFARTSTLRRRAGWSGSTFGETAQSRFHLRGIGSRFCPEGTLRRRAGWSGSTFGETALTVNIINLSGMRRDEPDPAVVAQLERLASHARRGDIQGFAAIVLRSDTQTIENVAVLPPARYIPALGAIEALKHALIRMFGDD